MKKCSWCGHSHVEIDRTDALGEVQHFHKKCWYEMREWLSEPFLQSYSIVSR